MIILSIDQSTSVGSATLLRDGDVLAERTWSDNATRNQQVFSVLPRMLSESGLRAADVDLFAVGRGPGAFSGIRMSISAVRGMALPGGTPVQALPSCEAIARDVWTETGMSPVVIAGDARRARVWIALFHAAPEGLRLARPVSLVAAGEIADALREATAVASPDWDRIGSQLINQATATVRVLSGQRVARATVVGELAWRRALAAMPSDPCTPLYLHPSVFVEPRFPADTPGRATLLSSPSQASAASAGEAGGS